MRKITEIPRLKFQAQLSHEKIARAVGLSKGAVTKYVSLAQAQGLTWPLPADLDEAGLIARLSSPKTAATTFVEPDYPKLHQELKRKGVTLQLLWSEYVAVHGARARRYTQFRHHYRQWRDRQQRSMRQIHRAGEKLFIDYCGPTVAIVDGDTGEVRDARIFVAVLGASNYTYAEATWTQSLPDWIASHQRAFRYIGGVRLGTRPQSPNTHYTVRTWLQQQLDQANDPGRCLVSRWLHVQVILFLVDKQLSEVYSELLLDTDSHLIDASLG